jgi:hypothetical protein
MGANGRDYVEKNYSINAVVSKYDELIRSILNGS